MADVAFSPDGTPVCYEVHGSGEPALVLVHGWSCDRSYWSRQLDHFGARYQVVTIDAPAEIAVAALEQSVGDGHAIVTGLAELAAPIVAINADYRPTSNRSSGME